MTSQTPGGRSIMFSTLIFVSLNLVTVPTVRILIKINATAPLSFNFNYLAIIVGIPQVSIITMFHSIAGHIICVTKPDQFYLLNRLRRSQVNCQPLVMVLVKSAPSSKAARTSLSRALDTIDKGSFSSCGYFVLLYQDVLVC